MKSYKSNEFFSDSPSVVALGCFDGVHIGHQTVIRRAVNIAKDLSVKSAVWTFDESPRNFFIPRTLMKSLPHLRIVVTVSDILRQM